MRSLQVEDRWRWGRPLSSDYGTTPKRSKEYGAHKANPKARDQEPEAVDLRRTALIDRGGGRDRLGR